MCKLLHPKSGSILTSSLVERMSKTVLKLGTRNFLGNLTVVPRVIVSTVTWFCLTPSIRRETTTAGDPVLVHFKWKLHQCRRSAEFDIPASLAVLLSPLFFADCLSE